MLQRTPVPLLALRCAAALLLLLARPAAATTATTPSSAPSPCPWAAPARISSPSDSCSSASVWTDPSDRVVHAAWCASRPGEPMARLVYANSRDGWANVALDSAHDCVATHIGGGPGGSVVVAAEAARTLVSAPCKCQGVTDGCADVYLYQSLNKGCDWLPVPLVHVGDCASRVSPRVAASPDGSLHVVYAKLNPQARAGDNETVQWRQRLTQGDSFHSEESAAGIRENNAAAAATYDPVGKCALLYVAALDDDGAMLYSSYAACKGAWSPLLSTSVGQKGGSSLELLADPRGVLWATWVRSDNTLQGQCMHPGGDWKPFSITTPNGAVQPAAGLCGTSLIVAYVAQGSSSIRATMLVNATRSLWNDLGTPSGTGIEALDGASEPHVSSTPSRKVDVVFLGLSKDAVNKRRWSVYYNTCVAQC
eukprot:m51a1_g2897 hypothetical protein (423) ;mRNA; r:460955-462790